MASMTPEAAEAEARLAAWRAHEVARYVEAHRERGLRLESLDRDLAAACYEELLRQLRVEFGLLNLRIALGP